MRNDYPQAATDEAKKALDHRTEFGSECGTAVGWARATQLANREEISDEVIVRTYSFLRRASVYNTGEFMNPDGTEVCGSVMYAAWGGQPMLQWTEDVLKEAANTRSQEARPYPNEHAARIDDPAEYVSFNRVNDFFEAGVDAIFGIEEDGEQELQSIRFDSERFTAEEAQQWLQDHDFEYIEFEPAIEEAEKRTEGELVSFDFDGTLTTPMGMAHLAKEISDQSEAYIISAREEAEQLLEFAQEHGIKPEYVFATGSDEAKVEKVKELGIVRHYDDKPEVIAALEGVGILISPDMHRALPNELKVGDFVRWNTSNGFAQGRIIEIAVEGEMSADSGFTITGTEDDPAAKIRAYEYDEELKAFVEQMPALNVVHRFSTLELFSADFRNNTPIREKRELGEMQLTTGRTVRGYAAVYNSPSEDLGGFIEYIEAGAFDSALGDDVRALFNHDANLLLARTKSGTLKIGVDERGLWYEFDAPNTSTGNDLLELLKRGDVTQSSFGFTIEKDEWRKQNGVTYRYIKKVARLYDVSPVTYPAYPATTAALKATAEPRSVDGTAKPQESPAVGAGLTAYRLRLIKTQL